nr:MAG TPA: hypothetical protein [Caudoviricetes sp.]
MTRKRFNKLMRAFWTNTYMQYADAGIDININKLYKEQRNCKVVDDKKVIYAYSPYQYIYDLWLAKLNYN